METIETWIIEDVLNAIRKIDFSIEKLPLQSVHAATHSESSTIVINPDTITIFELAEEYEHAKNEHRRQWAEYDVRNPDEKEAHHLALEFVLDRWNYYEGSKNWLTFMTVTGTPDEFETEICESFEGSTQLTPNYVQFG